MARLPDGYSLNGNLAFQGQPAHGNTVAREMINPSQAQVDQSLQQEATRQVTRAEEQAAGMVAEAKLKLQRLALARNPKALPGLGRLDPDVLANTGLT
jgi:hypothetical protein